MITQGSIIITLQLLPPEVFAITITLQLHQTEVCNHYYSLQLQLQITTTLMYTVASPSLEDVV